MILTYIFLNIVFFYKLENYRIFLQIKGREILE